MEQVTRMVSGNPVAIFSKSGTCPVSHSVKYLLHDYGVNTAVYELDKIPRGREIEQALSTLGRTPPVVPAVFIGDELVGGSANDLYSLHLKGELRPMLIRVGAIWL